MSNFFPSASMPPISTTQPPLSTMPPLVSSAPPPASTMGLQAVSSVVVTSLSGLSTTVPALTNEQLTATFLNLTTI
jgi:hypothetical protein